MALVHCPECSNKVSDEAHMCPKCGCPLLSKSQARYEKAERVREKQRIEDARREEDHHYAGVYFVIALAGGIALFAKGNELSSGLWWLAAGALVLGSLFTLIFLFGD